MKQSYKLGSNDLISLFIPLIELGIHHDFSHIAKEEKTKLVFTVPHVEWPWGRGLRPRILEVQEGEVRLQDSGDRGAGYLQGEEVGIGGELPTWG